MKPLLPSTMYSDAQRRVDEEAAKIITDDSVDHKRYKVYIDHIKRETEKAILARVGHWRSGNTREGWRANSATRSARILSSTTETGRAVDPLSRPFLL